MKFKVQLRASMAEDKPGRDPVIETEAESMAVCSEGDAVWIEFRDEEDSSPIMLVPFNEVRSVTSTESEEE